MRETSECFVLGKEVTLPNGHKYAAPPFIVFDDREVAQRARDMIEAVSGENVMLVDNASLYQEPRP